MKKKLMKLVKNSQHKTNRQVEAGRNLQTPQGQIKDSDVCRRCDNGQDTVVHSISSCQILVPYVDKIVNFLKTECTVNENITEKSYIFECKSRGLNHISLELKRRFFIIRN